MTGRRRRGGAGAAGAFGLLSVLGRGGTPTAWSPAWFPVVGATVGLGVGGAWWVGHRWWGPAVGAAVAVTADAALTGALHLDGLADSADAAGAAHADPGRRRAVAASPEVGVFGVVAVVLALGATGAALASVDPAPSVVVAVWAATRVMAAGVVVGAADHYVGTGTATLAAGGRTRPGRAPAVVAVVAGAGIVAACGVLSGPGGPAAALVAAGAGLVTVGVASRPLGGWTGDVVGAGIVAGQLAGVLAWVGVVR